MSVPCNTSNDIVSSNSGRDYAAARLRTQVRYPMAKLFDLFRTEDVRWFVAIARPCHSERC
jgi:hypothetical protein